MSKLNDLRALRNNRAKAAQELNAKYSAETRMPSEDIQRMDAILAEVDGIDADISREKRISEMALEDPQAQVNAALEAATRTPGAHSDEARALRAFMAGGVSAMSPEDRQRMLARQSPDIRNAMSTTTTTEGGYTTSPEYETSLDEALKAFGGMRSACKVIKTATGTTLNFPTADATAEVGEIVGQNAAVALGETAFGNQSLVVYKYSSKKIALPFELIQDSFIDIESYVQALLAVRLARIQNTHFTVGTGTGQPTGLVGATTAGVTGTTGAATAFTYDHLVDLEHSLDPAYRNGAAYMMNDAGVKIARKIKDGQSRPLFVPGYETGVPGGAMDSLMGRRIIINQDMAAPGANAKSILFGQFGKYIIRDVMGVTLFRMTDSAFTLNGQVGFVGFMRSGGNLIDAGAAIKHFVHSAT